MAAKPHTDKKIGGNGRVRKPTTKGGTSHVRTNAPPAGAVLSKVSGAWLPLGQTNRGGPGRPRNEIRLKFADLIRDHGVARVKEMLAGKKVTYTTKGKDGKTQVITELVFPKDGVILQALDLAARIAKVVGPVSDTDDGQDLPEVVFAVDPVPPDQAELDAARAKVETELAPE